MKHKSSILLCEMDNGTVNLYCDGVAVVVDGKQQTPINKIANTTLTIDRVREIIDRVREMLDNIDIIGS